MAKRKRLSLSARILIGMVLGAVVGWIIGLMGNPQWTDTYLVGGLFDVVLSDMAPATMGDHGTDALRSAALAESALALAETHLAPGGAVVVKVLEGGDVPQIVNQMRTVYEKVTRTRPRATRKESTELFLIGLRKKSAPEPKGA